MSEQTLRIDGQTIPFQEGQTIMDAALAADIYIPHLCHNPEFTPHGSCRLCTVVVNGKAVRSCLVKVVKLEGADVITVEGLGTPANPHLIQEAFVLAGAIQCGFCTPGMVMSTKALLGKNPNPSEAEVKEGIQGNLCRCTGYTQIVESILAASEKMGRH